MEIINELGPFWVTGIVINVTLVTLILVWVFKITRQKDDKNQDDNS